MKKIRWMAVLLGIHAISAHALGLGDAKGRIVVGEPLSVRIPLQGGDGAAVSADCVELQAAAQRAGDDMALTSGRLRVDHSTSPSTLLITTRDPLTQPVVNFQVRVGCGFHLTRDYQLLPAAPALLSPAPSPVSAPLVIKASSLPGPSRAGSVPHAVGDVTLNHASTLRLLSRQRFPGDSAARVRFIRRVAALNPELFSDTEAAFDQPLPAGTSLRLPLGSTGATAVKLNATPPAIPPVALPPSPALPVPVAGKGRLIVGNDDRSLPAAVGELESNVDRLITVMTEQMQVQMVMTERIRKLESELEAAKSEVATQHVLTRRLDDEIRLLRDDQARGSYIQLVLAILLGGFAGAAFLRWYARRAEQESAAKAPPHEPVRVVPATSIFARSTPAAAHLDLNFDDLSRRQ